MTKEIRENYVGAAPQAPEETRAAPALPEHCGHGWGPKAKPCGQCVADYELKYGRKPPQAPAPASPAGREWLVTGTNVETGSWSVDGPPLGPNKIRVREVAEPEAGASANTQTQEGGAQT